MASYNGAAYIREQIDSILCQLSAEDELLISDDGSDDGTPEIVLSYHDPRIRLIFNNPENKGVTHNFENALSAAWGDYIFLSDQDDVWLPGKIAEMTACLQENHCQCVTCNCSMTDAQLHELKNPYFDWGIRGRRSFLANLIHNSWQGCCMAFDRQVLELALPFPKGLVVHDSWIGLLAQLKYRCGWLADRSLVMFRRHEDTVTFAGRKSTLSLAFKIRYRLHLLWHVLIRTVGRMKTENKHFNR